MIHTITIDSNENKPEYGKFSATALEVGITVYGSSMKEVVGLIIEAIERLSKDEDEWGLSINWRTRQKIEGENLDD